MTTTNVMIDQAALNASGPVRCIEEGSLLRFMIERQTATTTAVLKGDGSVDLFPERDSGHRALLAALTG